ncbi:MAG: DUF4670 domain-containing protein [Bacteroidetes bacterium]|nr:DUF4670 domain-containing protein [Bacteroidota bacterium]
MKETTRRKIMGNWLYTIYRRMRYIRFIKRLRKERQKMLKTEQEQEQQEVKLTIRQQLRLERKLEKAKQKRLKKEDKIQRKQVRDEIRARQRAERLAEQEKQKIEKRELRKEQLEVKQRLKEKAEQDRQLEQQQREQAKLQKKLRKQRIRRLRPYLLKRRTREFFRGLRSINRHTLRDWFDWTTELVANKNDRNRFLKIFFNSLFMFMLSYLVIYIIGQLITVWAATTFDYKLIVFPYKIYYNIDSDQWTPDAVKILFSILPFTGLILGTIGIILYSSKRNEAGYFKLFFLWAFVHGMVMFFGSTLMGTLLNQGFGWVIAYLYYRDTGKMIFSIISIFALFIAGTSITRSFLISGNAYFNFVKHENRKFLFLSQVLLPAIIGTGIMILLKIPTDDYYTTNEEYIFEVSKISTILLILLPVGLAFKSMGDIYFDEEPRIVRFAWPFLLITLAIFLLHMFILAPGIPVSP